MLLASFSFEYYFKQNSFLSHKLSHKSTHFKPISYRTDRQHSRGLYFKSTDWFYESRTLSPSGNYMSKANNKDIHEICSKLTIKTPEQG